MSRIKVNYFTNFINRRRNRYPAAQTGVLWVKAGTMSYRLVDGSEGEITEGQFCFYNSAELMNLETHVDDNIFDAIAIILDSSTLNEFLQLQNEYQAPQAKNYPISNCNEYINSIISLVLNNLERETVSQQSLKFLSMALLAELVKEHPHTIDHIKQSMTLSISQKVIHYIEGNIEDVITLDQTANYLGMSTATLKRRLSADGLSFSNLLKIKRINYAATMLRNTQDSITQIAFASGFKSAAHFSTAFKGVQELTPKEFRAKLRRRKA